MKLFDFLSQNRKNEIWGFLLLALSIFVFISLVSFDQKDISFYTSSPNVPADNWTGWLGAHLAFGLLLIFGYASHIIPLLALIWSISKFRNIIPQKLPVKFIGIFLILIAVSTFLALKNSVSYQLTLQDLFRAEEQGFRMGGIIGYFCSVSLASWIGNIGAYLLVIVFISLGFLLATEFSLTSLFVYLINLVKTAVVLSGKFFRKLFSGFREFRNRRREEKETKKKKQKNLSPRKKLTVTKTAIAAVPPPPIIKKEISPVLKEAAASHVTREGEFKLPLLEFLNLPDKVETKNENVNENAKLLEDSIRSFGVDTRVVQVNAGPVITSYELELATGVKVNSITSLADDISLAMKTPSVRIVAPIPGKSVVGIEIPNSNQNRVCLGEIVRSQKFQEAEHKLTLGLGKDALGNILTSNLADMPHMLIAGTTGSGKTVCLNALIISLLYRATPDEVKFLMIDPKRVELVSFDGIPHLVNPVVTETKKAASALKWVISEMEDRYKLLARAGARNIDRYNEIRKSEEPLPYMVVIIDELADLMAVAQATVEDAITRLAQLSRAVGIHLILATQRPSVDVITGVIKANFPYRISFQVSSKVDSRTVLDMNGAEKLLGKGDMLFLPAGLAKPIRAQCSLITDQEIEKVVAFLKQQEEPDYSEEIFKDIVSGSHAGHDDEDELFEPAVRIVLDSGQASASTLQRRFRIGYNRAARLIDRMEAEGIIGPSRGSKPRQVLNHNPEFIKAQDNEDESA